MSSKILRKRNYGFEKLINEYSNSIFKAGINKTESSELVKNTWALIEVGTMANREALEDVFISLNERISKLQERLPKILKRMFMHGGSKVMNTKGEKLNFAQPSYDRQVQALVQTNSQYLRKYTKDQQRVLMKAVEVQFKKGKTYKETQELINSQLENFSKKRAYLIASTEAVRASTTAMQTIMEENGAKKYKWITANDTRVCPTCKKYSGRVFEFGKNNPLPIKDTHPLCRCVTVFHS